MQSWTCPNTSVYFDMYLNVSLVGSSGALSTSSTPTFLSSGYNGQVSTTPEPSSMALLGTGLVGLVPMIRRRRR